MAVVHYFDSWGRAERFRWLFMLNDIEFTNKYYSWEEWCEKAPSVEFGQLPLIEYDGHVLVQSLPTERFIARRLSLIPADPYSEYLSDSIVACFDDYFRHFASFNIYENDLEGYVKYYQSELKTNLA